jgi:hypothetical protein
MWKSAAGLGLVLALAGCGEEDERATLCERATLGTISNPAAYERVSLTRVDDHVFLHFRASDALGQRVEDTAICEFIFPLRGSVNDLANFTLDGETDDLTLHRARIAMRGK